MRVFTMTNPDVRVPMACAIDDGVRLRRAEIIETDTCPVQGTDLPRGFAVRALEAFCRQRAMVTPAGLAKGNGGLTALPRAQGSPRHACAEASGAC